MYFANFIDNNGNIYLELKRHPILSPKVIYLDVKKMLL